MESLKAPGLELCSLASGSSGNAILCRCGHTSVLLDVGLSAKRIEEALTKKGCSGQDLTAILITHEHSDHIAGLEVLAKRYQLPIYLTRGTYEACQTKFKAPEHCDWHLIEAGHAFQVGSLQLLPFSISHDAAEPVMFKLSGREQTALLLTDLGEHESIDEAFLRGVDFAFIEANYDEHLLKTGPYSWPLKQRILGKLGHLSNLDSAELIWKLKQGGCDRFALSHLSQQNNMAPLAELTVRQGLAERGLVYQLDYELSLSPRLECSDWYVLGGS